MDGLSDKDKERIEILCMEISGMLTACNHILKVVASLAEELAGISKKLHDVTFYSQMQQKNDETPKAEGDQ